MSTMTRRSYEQLIHEDLEWLIKHTPDSCEKAHVEQVLRQSAECYYGHGHFRESSLGTLTDVAERMRRDHLPALGLAVDTAVDELTILRSIVSAVKGYLEELPTIDVRNENLKSFIPDVAMAAEALYQIRTLIHANSNEFLPYQPRKLPEKPVHRSYSGPKPPSVE